MNILSLSADQLSENTPREKHILFVMPSTDMLMAERCAALMSSRAGSDGCILIVNDTLTEGFISIINRAFLQSESEFFGYVAQDAFPGRGWLKIAVDSLNQTDKSLLAFNDGKWHGLLAAFGLVRRKWAKEVYEGELFFPGYQRHYADTELTLIAKSNHQLCYNARSVLVEVDWEKDNKPVDVNDKQLFNLRSQSLFNGRVSDKQYCSILNRKG